MTVLNKINEILYFADPMKTGCIENRLEDEYFVEAVAIDHQLQLDENSDIETIKSSVKYVFELFFWEECLSDCDIEEIAKEIEFVI